MKKTILLTSIAALTALSSCTMDEIKEVNQGTPIGFRTSVATRGAEASKYTLGGFYVTALEAGQDNAYFANVPFTRRGYDDYKSNDNYFWPGNGRTLSFHAYAPSIANMGNATVTITDNDKKIENFVVKTDITEQNDLIYAYTGERQESDGNVSLQFFHKLSKVTVGAYTTSDNVYKFAGVKIGGVKGKGSLTGIETDAETWTLAEDNPTVFVYDGSQSVVEMKKNQSADNLLGELKDADNNDVDNCAFMIPQTFTSWDKTNSDCNGAYIAVNIQINTKDGVRIYPAEEKGDYGWVAIPIPAGTWLAGYEYYYSLNFSDGAGYVAPGVDVSGVGSEVLGDATITLTTSLPAMGEGIENAVANPNMIGKWTAQSFKEVVTSVITTVTTTTTTTNPETGEMTSSSVTEELTEPTTAGQDITEDLNVANGTNDAEKTNIFNDIDGIIDNWSIIYIVDGTTLDIRQQGTEEWAKEPYRVNSKNYILIDTYLNNRDDEGSIDENDYYVRPQIQDIKKAEVDEDGYAEIVLVYTENYKEESTETNEGQTVKVERTGSTIITQTIKYIIEYIESEEQPTEPTA